MQSRDDSGRSAIVVAALGRYLADRAAGCERPVAFYASLFPGFEEAVVLELTGAASASTPEETTDGAHIGPYRVLGELGSGGMGMVLLAEQAAPVRRRVAVKVVKPGMDTRAVLRRFEAERQALASMDHPNVARVFDAGTTDAGRPYFVMDLVDGVPLAAYCDRRRLTVSDRLELFLQVCAGVQHAHQRGIVHRDLKPGNVLIAEVDGAPVAKVIDFGLAKAMRSSEHERTELTVAGDLLGTPEYMSPEQAVFETTVVDTRSDVYALGVMLYELLTGELPLTSEELRAGGYTELERVLREREPARPSTRVTSAGERGTEIAARRRTTPPALARAVRGDLDRIAMKALQKQVDHRYDSVAELSADIRRYLRHEPVLAMPPSRGYLLAKFLRRHRVGAVAAVSIAIALAGGLVVSTLQMQRADAQARRATASLGVAFDAIDRMLSRVGERSLADVPRMEPVRRGLLEDALGLHRELLALGGDDAVAREQVARSWSRVGRIHQQLGDLEAAAHASREALVHYAWLCAAQPDRPALRREAAVVHHDLGLALSDLDRPDEAMVAYQNAIADFDRALAWTPEHRETAIARAGALRSISIVHGRRGEASQSLAAAQEARDVMRRLIRESDPPEYRAQLAFQSQQIAYLLGNIQRPEEAEEAYREAISLLEKIVAEAPESRVYRRRLAISQAQLGDDLRQQNRTDEALELGLAALAERRRLAAEFPDTPDLQHDLGGSLNNVAMLLRAGGDAAAAYAMLEEAIAAQQEAVRAVPRHPNYQRFLQIQHRQAMLALRDLKRHRALAVHAEAFAGMVDGLENKLDAAERFAWCVQLARRDSEANDADREALCEQYASRAVAILRAAIEAGLDPERLRRPGFRPLSKREEFLGLLGGATGR